MKGKHQDFPSKNFCITVRKKAVGEPISLSTISGIEKVWMRRLGGGVSKISVGNFLSHSAEKFRRGTIYGVTDFRYRKILCLRGL